MSDTIKCACSHCGAKYRLPVEAQGRRARCKRCGKKFEVPREKNLEDTILSWLAAPEEEEEEELAQPRVISMPDDRTRLKLRTSLPDNSRHRGRYSGDHPHKLTCPVLGRVAGRGGPGFRPDPDAASHAFHVLDNQVDCRHDHQRQHCRKRQPEADGDRLGTGR